MNKIYLSKFTINDFKDFYSIKCEDNNIYWTNFASKPDEGELYIWVKKQLNNEKRIILLAKSFTENATIGYGYIDLINEELNSVEISYAISKKYENQGFGNEIVKLLVDFSKKAFINLKKISAWVLITNIKSQKCLLYNNFIETDNYREVLFTSNKYKLKMIKYDYSIKY